MTALGFVGAGRIGLPMVARLVGAGHRVHVLDASAAAREAVAAVGAVPVDGIAELARDASVVLLCPYSDAQVQDLCLDGELLDLMPRDSAVVVHTTGSPTTVARIVERAEARGIEVVDAPISGGPQDIEAGRVTLYQGATIAGAARVRPVLAAYGDPVLHLGPPGAGQLVKLVNNAVFAANIGVLAQALRTAALLGIRGDAVLTGLAHGSGASSALLGVAAAGSVDAFAATVGEFIGKDVAVVRDVAAELGVDLGLLAQAHGVLAELMAPEHRDQLVGARPTGTTPQ